jgi:Ser/Thr protein kinase RdoA (MazF antagonist)
MNALLRSWSIGPVDKVLLMPSYWGKTSLITASDGTDYIIKEKGNFLNAEREYHLLVHLSQMGAPVSVPLLTRDSNWFASQGDRIFCLYPKLPGEVIDDHYHGNAQVRAKVFGDALADLHGYLRKYDSANQFSRLQLVEHIQKRAIPRIKAGIPSSAASTVEGTWHDVLEEIGPFYDLLPKQLIHRDPNPANFLFQDGQLTGILDFEMVVNGPRIFDLCYCGTSLLVSAYPDNDKMQLWPGLFRGLSKGYQETFPLKPVEKSSLYAILVMIELLFAGFSLETGAYESAQCNLSLIKWLRENRQQLQS